MKIPALLVATCFVSAVYGHGGMIEPKPRGLTTMGLDIASTFGHPIPMRASYTNGKGGNCLGFTPDSNLQTIPTGKSKIKMRANDGANHIGPCTVYLVNPDDKSKKLKVGEHANCMRSLHPGGGHKGQAPIPAEMEIDVPSTGLPCKDGHCVLEFFWEARHIGPPYEEYNNCADVKIGGGGGNGGGSTPSANDADKPNVNPAPNTVPGPAEPKPVPASGPAPVPQNSGGGYVYVGAHPDKPGMTVWCNRNCPSFCPTDYCKKN